MDEYKSHIPILERAERVSKINKGFSFDQKYVIDDKYLLRTFSVEEDARRRTEFDTIQQLNAYSNFVPDALDYGVIPEIGQAYMVLSYFPGDDAEVALKLLSEKEQYEAGIAAGDELKKLHHFPAPENTPSWFEHKKQKTDKYLEALDLIEVDKGLKDMLITYIGEHLGLMKGRPNTFQHDDFHPANLLIHQRKFSGIIDFQRMDWGDPVHDLHKLGFFSSRISVPFTKGIIDGYHAGKGLGYFWELYALYSAIHMVSALVWGKRMGNYEKMLAYSMDVVRDHKDFRVSVPEWYR